MKSFDKNLNEYRTQMRKGEIQKVYRGVGQKRGCFGNISNRDIVTSFERIAGDDHISDGFISSGSE
jgi:hypothetical protein